MRHRLVRSLVLTAVAAALATGAAACGGGSDEPPPAETTTAAPTEGDAANGATVWESAGCGGCHTLSAAGSEGSVGPNLDDLKPDFETTVSQVTNGGGGMPAFDDSLSEQEILDVSAYVVRSTGG